MALFMNKYDKTMRQFFMVPGAGSLPNNNYSLLVPTLDALCVFAARAQWFCHAKSNTGFMEVSQ